MTNQLNTIPLIQIPSMPSLWHMDNLLVGRKDVSGALAHWAVYQSPYVAPEGLTEAVAQFMGNWPPLDFAPMSSTELFETVRAAIARSPLVLAWGERKNGRDGNGFVSRYDKPEPDDDFIDLDALARNVVHEIVLWAQVEQAQDAMRGRQGDFIAEDGIGCGTDLLLREAASAEEPAATQADDSKSADSLDAPDYR